MKNPVLLDSHSFIWLAFSPETLGAQAKAVLIDTEIYVSIASVYELTIKYSSGKLPHSPEELLDAIALSDIQLLALLPAHLKLYTQISLPHKDPFDRLLIAQAQCENLPLLTADQTLLDSPYPTINARK